MHQTNIITKMKTLNPRASEEHCSILKLPSSDSCCPLQFVSPFVVEYGNRAYTDCTFRPKF